VKLTRILIVGLLAVGLLAGCGQVPEAPVGLSQFTDSGIDPNSWARVPAGIFLTGQYDLQVDLDYEYEIMVTEVTNAQYAQFLNEALAAGVVRIAPGDTIDGYDHLKGGAIRYEGNAVFGHYEGDEYNSGRHEEKIPAGDYVLFPFEDIASRINFDGSRFTVKEYYENHPVTMVSWFGAKAYADFYGYRLPTELEWEKAARGMDDNRPYAWGDLEDKRAASFYKYGNPFQTKNGWTDTAPVGFYNGKTYGNYQTIDAKSPYGVYDMNGNVAEWVGDIWLELHDRVFKGGHKNTYAIDGRVWKRNSAPPQYVSPNVGFRCVRDI